MTTLSAQQVLQLLADHGVSGKSALTEWLARADAESSLRSDVVNSIGAVGLFQINQPVHVRDHPTWTTAWLQNPSNNVEAARIVSNNWTNTRPWVTSALMTAANTPWASLQANTFLQSPVEKAANAALPTVAPAINAVSGPFQLASNVWSVVTNPTTWMRVAVGVAGVALIVVGLNSLSGGKVVQAGKKAAVVAAV